MPLIETQNEFMTHVAMLIEQAHRQGFLVSGGELWRTDEQQQWYVEHGFSKTENSMHLFRLAIDLNFFLRDDNGDFQILRRKVQLQPIGDYWQNLHRENQWGGNWERFYDPGHFERRRQP